MATADISLPNWAPSQENAEFTHKASEACYVGDLLWYDATNHVLRSAAVFTDQGSAGPTQQGFAAVFAGVSSSKQLSTDSTARNCRTVIDQIWEFPCTSSTFAVGDYVAPSYSSGLNSQNLVKVTDPSLAIGRVVKEYTSATTKVKVRLTSPIFLGKFAQDGASGTFAGQQANFRNILDGGDMTTNPAQRGTSQAADITSTVTYGPDRWAFKGGASSAINWSIAADTAVVGFSKSLKFQRKSGNTDVTALNLVQVVETADSIRFQGRRVTFSFWAKAGANYSGGSLTVKVESGTGTDQSAANMIAGSWTGQTDVVSTTQAITTTMTRYQFTGTVPAGCTQLGVQITWTPVGTAGADDSVTLNGFQLEDGGAATPFEHKDIELELALCQRYYVRFSEPANGVVISGAGMINGGNVQQVTLPLPTTMRTAPTVTVSAGSLKFNIAGTPTAVGGGFAAGTTHTQVMVTVVGTVTATSGQATALQGGGGSGYVEASADY
jgi:hypothetical protein